MARRFCRLVITVMALGCILSSSAVAKSLKVRVEAANIRSGPGITHAILLAVPRNTILPLLTTQKDWHKVRLDDGRQGWIANAAVELPEPVRSRTSKSTMTSSAVPQQDRVALVIGNSNYKVAPLANPRNDATDMTSALRTLGFRVTTLVDAPQRKMEDEIRLFGQNLARDSVGLFYYAGHGVQVAGHNYLIPVDAEIKTESEVKYEAVNVGRVLDAMENAGNQVNIVILDACRDNPFARGWRSTQQGLAPIQAAKGLLISYATAPGELAADGRSRNGLFTHHLLRHMTLPNMPIERVFKKVRSSVVAETGGKQTPWESSSLTGDFYFRSAKAMPAPLPIQPKQPTVAKEAPSPSRIPVTSPSPSAGNKSLEAQMWTMVQDSQHPDDLLDFMVNYPKSPYTSLALLKLKQLTREQQQQRQAPQQRFSVTFQSSTPGVQFDKPNPMEVPYGGEVIVVASKEGYRSKNVQSKNILQDTVVDVGSLDRIKYQIRFETSASDVEFNLPNPVEVLHGDPLTVVASKEGFFEQSIELESVVKDMTLTFPEFQILEERIGHFIKYANGTALDTRTGLMWMTKDFRNVEGRQVDHWEEARKWVAQMNQQQYGGYSDWRLPTVSEYQSSYDRARRVKSYKNKPLGCPRAFEDGAGKFYLTSDVASSSSVWGVSFASGGSRTWDRDLGNRNTTVRLVRYGSDKMSQISK